MVFFGLNISESLVKRGSGTSTTAVWTSKRPAEAVVGVSPRVNALKMVVFPDWGNPMIPSFILTLVLGVVYFGAQIRPKWRNRQTRTTQNRVPSGNVGSIPTFGTRIHSHYTPRVKHPSIAGGCFG